MKPKPLKTLKVTFNILDQQREHTTSKQRNYLVDNVRKVIQSPAVQERLRKRELVGYFGHYLREHAGKMHLDEKVMVPTPGGGHILVDAVPACVCTAIDIDDDGNLTHVEEIADNLEGRKTLSLFESGIGGFSWACDGGVYRGNTLISDLAGFDYVRQPLFSSNRPYVLDSAAQDSEAERAQLVLDSMVDLGVDEGVATGALQAFYASSANEAEHYRTGLEGQMLINAEVMAELEETKALLDAAQGRDSRRSGLLADMAKECALFIPDDILDSLANPENADDLIGFKKLLESAVGINATTLPIVSTPGGMPKVSQFDPSEGVDDLPSAPTYGYYE